MRFKHFFAFLIICAIAVLVGRVSYVESQDQVSTARAVQTVLDGGILYPEAKSYRVLHDEFNDFNVSLWDSVTWGGAGAVSAQDSLGGDYGYGGPLFVSTAAAANAYAQAILYFQGFRLPTATNPRSPGATLEFETRIGLNDVSACQAVIGLVAMQDSLARLGGTATNGLYFLKKPASARLYVVMAKSGGAADTTDTGVDLVRNGWKTLRIAWNGARVRFLINNALVHSSGTATKIPTAANLRPAYEVRATAAAAKKMWVDYVTIKQRR